MISVNGVSIDFTSFPDNTTSFRYNPCCFEYNILWRYDDDRECILLWYLVNHIRENSEVAPEIVLTMPYIPNARMDRVKAKDEVFTLKWFSDFINLMYFDKIVVHDPHSNVSTALINHVVSVGAENETAQVLETLEDKNVILCYPDEGAAKRYSSQIGRDYVFCIKHRDWRTGKIERLELTTPEKVVGRNVLIVDDICSRGGTFTFTAKALKEAGAGEIYLYVTHCENTIFNGEILKDGLISHVFTTDSIYRGNHVNITVLRKE